MNTQDIPDISHLEADALLKPRSAVDTKLDQERAALKLKAEALDLKCTDANGKKPRRKSKTQHED
jgi:hypothetical protein